MADALATWFLGSARRLPFRPTNPTAPRDPYVVLVSEIMLQQTQVERVVERFAVFMAKFPSLNALADASVQDVLSLWSGLGYYRRARLLHEAARRIVAEGRLPATRAEWRRLPGIGPYTSGALASFVSGEASPAVDGNVARVIGRLHGSRSPMSRHDTEVRVQNWMDVACRSGVRGAPAMTTPGVLNEALIELGAVVCTPRNPRCESCPLSGFCASRGARSLKEASVRRGKGRVRPRIYCAAVLLRDRVGRVLMEPRGSASLWPGMWQAPTLERSHGEWTGPAVKKALGVAGLVEHSRFTHHLTHREARFSVWSTDACGSRTARSIASAREGSRWVTLDEAVALPLSSPQRRILGLCRELEEA